MCRNHKNRIRLLRHELDQAQRLAALDDVEIRELEQANAVLLAENAALCQMADRLAGIIVTLAGELEAARAIAAGQEREIEQCWAGKQTLHERNVYWVCRTAEQAAQIAALRRERDELRKRLEGIENPPF